jgi:hypothetical protein
MTEGYTAETNPNAHMTDAIVRIAELIDSPLNFRLPALFFPLFRPEMMMLISD